jgi:hypothetical protein
VRTPRALPAVKGPKRAVDPRLALALRVLLEGRHRGRANGATWEQLRDELVADGLEVGVVRRLQEAASHLRRVGTGGSKVPIGATSQAGVYLIVDADDKKLALSERLKRLRAEAEEVAALDVALADEIIGFLARVSPERDAVEEALTRIAADGRGGTAGTQGPAVRHLAGEDGTIPPVSSSPAAANNELPQRTPSPGERVAGEEGSPTEQHGAGRPASGSNGASQHTETLQRRGSGEGGPPASPAAANAARAPLAKPVQLGLLVVGGFA